MNLKKLQTIARRRLELEGEIVFVQKDGSSGRILAASVAKPSLELKHVITYSDADSLDPADVYHEFCRAKLYEMGFRTIENAALSALRDCSKDDPKFIFDANSSIVVVSEVYTHWMLYTYFPARIRRKEAGNNTSLRIFRRTYQPSHPDGILGSRWYRLLQTCFGVGRKTIPLGQNSQSH